MQKIGILLQSSGFKSLAGDSFWTMFSQVFIVLVNFGTVYVLANMLSTNDYGQFKLITTWLGIAIGVGYTGYNYTLPQKISKNQDYSLLEASKKTFIYSLPTFLGLFLMSIYYFYNGNLNLGSGFFFGAILAPILCASSIVNLYYMGRKNFKMFALAQNFVDVIQLIVIATIAYLTQNFVLIISAYFAATIIANILIILKSFFDDKKYKASHKFQDKTILADDSSESENHTRNKLNFSAIVMGFSSQIDKLLIFHVIGAVPLAIYSIVTALSDQARTPIKAISAALFPRMTGNTFTKRKLVASYLLLTFLCVVIFVTLLLVFPYIFKYFFPKYIEYVYLANLSAVLIIFAPNQLLFLYTQSKNNLNPLNTNANITTVLQVVLFSIAALMGSIILFLYSRIVIAIVSTVYIIWKIRKV